MAFKKWTRSSDQLRPDTRYNSLLVSKFINSMMWDGKKSITTGVMYDALEKVSQRMKDATPVEVFEKAVQNCKPNVEVRSKRVGGSNYQVPMAVNRKRQQALSFRWIREAARGRKGKPMADALAQEFLDAFKGEGSAVTAKDNVHRMAEANKAFSHFAW